MQMNLILLLIIMGGTFIPIFAIFLFFINKASYKNVAFIARQTGRDPNDVIWIRDNFKVKYVDGSWVIMFYKLKGEKTPSVDGKWWTKFVKKGNEKHILKLSREEWETQEIGKHIRRGIYFYETTEGEYFPMTIQLNQEKGPHFSLVNQDNRRFIGQETQDVNNLTKNKKKETMMMWVLIALIAALLVIFLVGGYYENSQRNQEMMSMAQTCGEYARIEASYMQNVTAAIQSGPNFIQNTMQTVGGRG